MPLIEVDEQPEGIPFHWNLKTVDAIRSPEKKSIISGPFGSNISSKYFVHSGVPVIRGNNLKQDVGVKFIDEGFVFLTAEKANDLGTWAKKDDLIFTAAGTIGQVGILTGKENFERYIISNKQLRLTVDKSQVLPLFAYYWFSSPLIVDTIIQRDTGSTIPLINLSVLKSLPIPVPSLIEQESITSILSSLDDKINLLHRQNKILEALAETLFRQWFMEDPGQDWEIGTVADLFKLQRGFDLPSQNRIDGKYPIVTSSGSNGTHTVYRVKGPGVTTGRSGLLGHVFYVDENFWPLNTSLFIVEFKIAKPLFAYFFLKTLDIISLNGGSAVPTLNRNDVHQIETRLPPKQLVKTFETYSGTYFQKIKSNINQIRTLTQLRDALLPKLMSGEIRVKN